MGRVRVRNSETGRARGRDGGRKIKKVREIKRDIEGEGERERERDRERE